VNNPYMPEKYEVTVVCSNCDIPPTVIEINKGKHVDETECPKCGNRMLRLCHVL